MRNVLLAAVAGCIVTANAHAATFLFSFTDSAGAVLASGALTTSDTLNALGGYDMTSITGIANGQVIVRFDVNPYTPATAYASLADGSVSASSTPGHSTGFNNTIYTGGGAPLDIHGLVFLTSDTIFNVFHTPSSGDIFGYSALSENPVFFPPPRGTFAITAVPEPASWAMMIGGFGLIGAGMRRRKASLGYS